MNKNYTNCYIAFLDILGFKELIKTTPCDELYSIFTSKMKNPLSAIHKGTEKIFDMKEVKFKVMSDSVCLCVDSSIQNALFGLICTCADFQVELMKLSTPILCRGAIVRGDILWDGDIIYGPGFIDAYKMEENNAKYPRIIMTRSTYESSKKNTEESLMNDLSNLLFVDYDDFLTINSMDLFEGFDTHGTYCENLNNHILDVLGDTVDNSVREKYMYLKANLLRWYKPESRMQSKD